MGHLYHAIQELEIIGNHIDGMCRDLRRLYDMTIKLVEEDAFMDTPPSAECKPGHEIWALAEELSKSMTEWPEQIEAAQEMLNDLAKLEPDRDEYDYITNKAYE